MKVRVFTDGACSGNPGPGGWGAILLLPNTTQIISGHDVETTNNRMELIAVVQALNVIKSVTDYTKVDIYSDSAYVVNAINNGWLKKWQKNGWKTIKGEEVKSKDLWTTLIKLLSQLDVNFIKVRGHSGDKYNEDVDGIARKQCEIAKGMLKPCQKA